MHATTTLWTEYAEGSESARTALLDLNLPLVRHLAHRTRRALGAGVELDDLVGAGTVGLVQAVESFDGTRGVAFSTFATPRIRGAMLDDLRRRDTASRGVRRKERRLTRAGDALRARYHREPTELEVGGELGVDAQRVREWKHDAEGARPVSLDRAPVDGAAVVSAPEGEDALERLEREEVAGILAEAIADMKEQERTVLSLYYFEELKMREIAEVLGVTEGRISQIHQKALRALRARLGHLREAA